VTDKKIRPIKLVIWRHGQTDWNVQGRFQGHTDIPLNSIGEYQVKHAAQTLLSLKPTQIISSDLTRAKQTATALANLTELPLKTYPQLRETDGGNWEGKTDSENKEQDPNTWARWVAGEDLKAGEIGESRSDVAKRVRSLLDPAIENLRRIETEEEAVLVVVTHGGTARAIIGSFLALPVSHWATLGGLANASWSVLAPRKFPSLIERDPNFDRSPFHPNEWQLIEHNAGTIPEPVLGNDEVI
jgi:glucosyl-3-phosphoglycerate phosphatase